VGNKVAGHAGVRLGERKHQVGAGEQWEGDVASGKLKDAGLFEGWGRAWDGESVTRSTKVR